MAQGTLDSFFPDIRKECENRPDRFGLTNTSIRPGVRSISNNIFENSLMAAWTGEVEAEGFI